MGDQLSTVLNALFHLNLFLLHLLHKCRRCKSDRRSSHDRGSWPPPGNDRRSPNKVVAAVAEQVGCRRGRVAVVRHRCRHHIQAACKRGVRLREARHKGARQGGRRGCGGRRHAGDGRPRGAPGDQGGPRHGGVLHDAAPEAVGHQLRSKLKDLRRLLLLLLTRRCSHDEASRGRIQAPGDGHRLILRRKGEAGELEVRQGRRRVGEMGHHRRHRVQAALECSLRLRKAGQEVAGTPRRGCCSGNGGGNDHRSSRHGVRIQRRVWQLGAALAAPRHDDVRVAEAVGGDVVALRLRLVHVVENVGLLAALGQQG